MKITPLALHAALRIPALTSLFSDTLSVASIAVTEGGNVTITTTGPHGVSVGGRIGVSIIDALTPNPITAALEVGNSFGDIAIETEFEHDLTRAALDYVDPWAGFVRLGGFTAAAMNGDLQLVEVLGPASFVVRPPTDVTISLNGAEKLYERLEAEVIGWHSVTAASSTTLTFPTPATVSRSYTVSGARVARSIRVWAALDLSTAMRNFVRPDAEQMSLPASYLFVTPRAETRLSRDRRAKSESPGEFYPGVETAQLLLDGFDVFAFLPTEHMGGAVAAADIAHGQIFSAVLRTFNGLRLPRSELVQGMNTEYVAFLESHGAAVYDGATYVHRYSFGAPTYITTGDQVQPYEWTSLDAIEAALQAGTPVSPGSLYRVGAPALRDIAFTGSLPDGAPAGIFHDGMPQPLTAVVSTE